MLLRWYLKGLTGWNARVDGVDGWIERKDNRLGVDEVKMDEDEEDDDEGGIEREVEGWGEVRGWRKGKG